MRRLAKHLILSSLMWLTCAQANGQHIDSLENLLRQDTTERLSIWAYGKIRMQLAYFDQQVQLQDATPRIGVALKHRFRNGWFWFTGGEFGLRLAGNAQSVSTDPNNSGGVILSDKVEEPPVISLRQGYIGVQFGKFGRIGLGKLWSPYSQVGLWTDKFEVMGGTSSFVYSPTGTDGGGVGTGRSDNVLVYQNELLPEDRLRVSAQMQFFPLRSTEVVNNYGVSLRYAFPIGLDVGIGGQLANIPEGALLLDSLKGYNGRPTYLVGGLRYENERILTALTSAVQWSGDFLDQDSDTDSSSIFYNAWGIEAIIFYRFLPKWKVQLGFNHRMTFDSPEELPKNVREQVFLVGLQYMPFSSGTVYLEAGIDNSISLAPNRSMSVVQLGLKYVFDIRHPILRF